MWPIRGVKKRMEGKIHSFIKRKNILECPLLKLFYLFNDLSLLWYFHHTIKESPFTSCFFSPSPINGSLVSRIQLLNVVTSCFPAAALITARIYLGLISIFKEAFIPVLFYGFLLKLVLLIFLVPQWIQEPN